MFDGSSEQKSRCIFRRTRTLFCVLRVYVWSWLGTMYGEVCLIQQVQMTLVKFPAEVNSLLSIRYFWFFFFHIIQVMVASCSNSSWFWFQYNCYIQLLQKLSCCVNSSKNSAYIPSAGFIQTATKKSSTPRTVPETSNIENFGISKT